MSEQLTVFIGLFLDIVPYAVLCIVPFWGHFRLSKKGLLILSALFIVCLIGACAFCVMMDFQKGVLNTLFSFMILCICFALYAIGINARLSKLLYVFFVMATYSFYLTGVTNHFEAKFFPKTYNTYISATYVILAAILLTITLPFMVIFLRRHIRPAVTDSETPAWKIMWIIPAIFMLIFFIYNETYGLDRVSSWQFLSLLLLLAFGSFLIYYIALKMIEQTNKNARLSQSIRMAEQHLEMVQSHIAETKRARHDLRHHLSVLQSYTDDRQNTNHRHRQQF